MSTDRCTQQDHTPLGWGDHIRWQHEHSFPGAIPDNGARYAEARRGGNTMRASMWRHECEAIPRRFTAWDVYTGTGNDPLIRDLHKWSQLYAPGYGRTREHRSHMRRWIVSPRCRECVAFLTDAEHSALAYTVSLSPGPLEWISLTLLMEMAKDHERRRVVRRTSPWR